MKRHDQAGRDVTDLPGLHDPGDDVTMTGEEFDAMNAINWIACSDRLPDDDTTVLVYLPDEDDPVWLGFYGENECCCESVWHSVDGFSCEPTHWAELPAPPETE